jgi:hypothetical protein
MSVHNGGVRVSATTRGARRSFGHVLDDQHRLAVVVTNGHAESRAGVRAAACRLQVELDALANRKRRRGRFASGKRRRRSTAETVAAVRQLRADGLVTSAIAEKLGLSDRYVRDCLRGSRTPKTGVANPHGCAADFPMNGQRRPSPLVSRSLAKQAAFLHERQTATYDALGGVQPTT